LTVKKYIYFASDAHFGLPDPESSIPREKLFARWLDQIADSAEEIYLLGDIFDFWFEYRRVVPRGFTRVLGKIAELSDKGIKVHFFTGNHDLWVFDYLPKETGMNVHRKPLKTNIYGKRFFLAHGDGVGCSNKKFHFLKSIFTNKVLQWLFARLHPNFAVWIAHKWSISSRYSKDFSAPFKGEENEELFIFANKMLESEEIDFFVFGHRHIPLNRQLKNGRSRIVNLGDWLFNFTYATFDGENIELKKFTPG